MPLTLGLAKTPASVISVGCGTIVYYFLAFINEKQLLCYHAADKKMATLFSFYDGNDIRSMYEKHDIKLLNVDETGNVSFIVNNNWNAQGANNLTFDF